MPVSRNTRKGKVRRRSSHSMKSQTQLITYYVEKIISHEWRDKAGNFYNKGKFSTQRIVKQKEIHHA
jgi:hypothetical protein